jgi:uncharacterized membrane protein
MTSDATRPPSLRLSAWLLVLMFAAIAAHLGYYYPKLPDVIASHFGARGKPDDWSSKQTFVAIMIALAAVLMLIFLAMGPILRRTPDSMINLPHKAYWLAPRRREHTIEAVVVMLRWVGVATLALLIGVNQLVMEANLHRDRTLSRASWILISGYLALVLFWSARLYGRFRRVDREDVPR